MTQHGPFRALLTLTAIAAFGAAGVAQAGDIHSYSKGRGAHAFSLGTNKALAIKDTHGDDRSVYAGWRRTGGGEGRLENSHGYGTTVTSKSDGEYPVRQIRACENHVLSPDDCGRWN